MNEQFLWTERYRPQKIADCVLPEETKAVFQKFVDDKFVPNLLLSGGPGVGKTTVALAMLNELDCDSYIVNGSLNVDKDSLRNDIQNYASTVSLHGGRKYIIIDEADYLNVTHVQPALRRFMEEFAGNCGFILTCNYKNKIIQPLHSRFSIIEFKINGKQKAQLAMKFLERCCYILDQEGVQYEKKVLAEIIMKYFPDWRRVLNELQRYSAQTNGKIDVGILASIVDTDIKELLDALKKKDFVAMRKWIGANSSIDSNDLFHRLYVTAYDHIKPESVPQLVLILGKYQYQAAFVVDQEINLAACMTEIMVDCEFQ